MREINTWKDGGWSIRPPDAPKPKQMKPDPEAIELHKKMREIEAKRDLRELIGDDPLDL